MKNHLTFSRGTPGGKEKVDEICRRRRRAPPSPAPVSVVARRGSPVRVVVVVEGRREEAGRGRRGRQEHAAQTCAILFGF